MKAIYCVITLYSKNASNAVIMSILIISVFIQPHYARYENTDMSSDI